MKPLCIACVLLLAASAGAQNRFVYVNTQTDPNIVTGYRINANGSLTQLAAAPFSTGGVGGNGNTSGPMNSMAIVPQGSAIYLYAANGNDPSVSIFTLDPQTGNLQLVGSPVLLNDDSGVYNMSASPNHQLLYVANQFSSDIHAYAIAPGTGGLTEIAGSPFAAGAEITGLQVTANGRFLVAAANSVNAVEVFSIASSGAIAQIAGSPFPSSADAYSVVSNCAGNLVYDVGFGGPDIDALQMASDGSLTPVAGSPFSNGAPPESDGGGGNDSFDLVLSPNNRFLFTTDSFSSDDSSLAIAHDGALFPVHSSPFNTGDWTGGVAVTAAGDFLYSVHFDDEFVDGRAIGPNGELTAVPGTPFASAPGYPEYTVGDSIITFPAPACHQ
jgi:6-phosphogluconolactonase